MRRLFSIVSSVNAMPQKPPNRALMRRACSLTLKTLRRRIGITQEELALASNIDRGYMGGLERGLHSPSIETIYKLLPIYRINFVKFAEQYEKSLRRAYRESE